MAYATISIILNIIANIDALYTDLLFEFLARIYIPSANRIAADHANVPCIILLAELSGLNGINATQTNRIIDQANILRGAW